MTGKASNQGRAYEFVCLQTLEEEIGKIRPVKTVKDDTWRHYESLWQGLSEAEQSVYKTGSLAAVRKIFELEPRILESGNDVLELLIQKDAKGEDGDVRDVLIIRRDISWEIGLSLKHNHFAVKHSRLSGVLDFGEKWYGAPCSAQYWADVQPVFAYLEREKADKRKFSELPDKDGDVYLPLLGAFVAEISRQYAVHKELPRRLVEYLLGKYDFYKVINMDSHRTTRIQTYNVHGTLGQGGNRYVTAACLPLVPLPSRIVHIGIVPGSATTAELYMDRGWQFSFRIHSAKTTVEPSLKFDIQVTGVPTTIITINCPWE